MRCLKNFYFSFAVYKRRDSLARITSFSCKVALTDSRLFYAVFKQHVSSQTS